MKNAKKLTLCGISAALCLAMLLIGGLTVLDLTIVMLCALVTMFIVVECGARMAWVYGAVCCTLALLLLPNKLYAMEFACFSVIFPLLKAYIERLPTVFAWILKLLTLELMLLGAVLVAQFVMGLGEEYFGLNLVTFALGAAVFVLYDVALTKCVTYYLVKLRKLLWKNKK